MFFLALAAGFAIGCVFARTSTVRMLAIIVGVCFAAFVLSPQLLQLNFGSVDRLIFFNANLRYSIHARARWAGAPTRRGAAVRSTSRVRLLIVYVSTIALRNALRASGTGTNPLLLVLLTTTLRGGRRGNRSGTVRGRRDSIALQPRTRTQARPSRRRRIVTVATIVVVVSGGFGVGRHYVAHRYAHTLLGPNADVANALFRWAQSTRDTRIAIVGFSMQYPLYGNGSSNFVEYLATRHSDRTSTPIKDCRTWRRAVNRGRFRTW